MHTDKEVNAHITEHDATSVYTHNMKIVGVKFVIAIHIGLVCIAIINLIPTIHKD